MINIGFCLIKDMAAIKLEDNFFLCPAKLYLYT